MPGFRGGVFASCVLCLVCLRLPLPYLSIGDLSMRRSCHTVPFSRPSLSFFPVSIPTPPSPSFLARALRAFSVCLFWRSLLPPLVRCTFLCFFGFFPNLFFHQFLFCVAVATPCPSPLFFLSYDRTTCRPSGRICKLTIHSPHTV